MEQQAVCDDEHDFYGKQYWLGHQADDLGHPDIYDRARYDLTERNLHWLKTLLKYALPPAKVWELGCSHGSFVALMTQAGYKAAGVEMSPWVVEFGRKTFEVPVHVGPVENLEVATQSLDAIALMDVLEHLSDPVTTMSHCMSLLKPGGFLLIQTPEFRGDMRYETLGTEKSPFLVQLKADEHLYLFSQQSITKFLYQLNAQRIYFEPAIFDHYDMFLIASKTTLEINSPGEIASELESTPKGRLIQALIDLRTRELEALQQLQVSEADRAARLEKINILTQQLQTSQTECDHLRASQIEQDQVQSSLLDKAKAKLFKLLS